MPSMTEGFITDVDGIRVGHFTDSYLGLIDLDQSHAGTFETIVATIGVPQAPAGTK